MKLLVLLAVLFIAYLYWRSQRGAQDRADAERGGGTAAPRQRPGAAPGAQEMVRCEVCALHLPRSDALARIEPRGTHYYCCAEHQRQALQREQAGAP